MADAVQRDRLGKRLRVGHEHPEAPRAEVVQNLASLFLWRGAVDRLCRNPHGGEVAAEVADAAYEDAPYYDGAAFGDDALHEPLARHELRARAASLDGLVERLLEVDVVDIRVVIADLVEHVLEVAWVHCRAEHLGVALELQGAYDPRERVGARRVQDSQQCVLIGRRLDLHDLVGLWARHAELVLVRSAEEGRQAVVEACLEVRIGRAELARLVAEERVVVLGVQDVQQVVDVLVGVRDGRSRKGDHELRAVGRLERGFRAPAADGLHPVHLVEDEQGLVGDDGMQLPHVARERLVVEREQVARAAVERQRVAPALGRHRRYGGVSQREAAQRQLIPEGGDPLLLPRLEAVLGANHHDAAREPQMAKVGEHAEHRRGLAGAGHREVGRAPNRRHEEGVEHLPVAQGTHHRRVHHVAELPEARPQLGVVGDALGGLRLDGQPHLGALADVGLAGVHEGAEARVNRDLDAVAVGLHDRLEHVLALAKAHAAVE